MSFLQEQYQNRAAAICCTAARHRVELTRWYCLWARTAGRRWRRRRSSRQSRGWRKRRPTRPARARVRAALSARERTGSDLPAVLRVGSPSNQLFCRGSVPVRCITTQLTRFREHGQLRVLFFVTVILSVFPSAYLLCLTICFSIHPPIHPSIHLSVCLSACLFLY